MPEQIKKNRITYIKLLGWTDEEYEKAVKALDDINPHWIAGSEPVP